MCRDSDCPALPSPPSCTECSPREYGATLSYLIRPSGCADKPPRSPACVHRSHLADLGQRKIFPSVIAHAVGERWHHRFNCSQAGRLACMFIFITSCCPLSLAFYRQHLFLLLRSKRGKREPTEKKGCPLSLTDSLLISGSSQTRLVIRFT